METNTAVLDRDGPIDTDQAPSPPYLDTLGELIDNVIATDKTLARQAAARAVAVDAARMFSESGDCGGSAFGGSAFGRLTTRRSLVAELACGLRIPERTAENLIEASRSLVHELPDTLAALAAGEISYRHADTLIHETIGLPADEAGALEKEALKTAGRLTVSQFDRRTRKLRERLNPESITVRHERSVGDRQVQFTPARDGMAWLSEYLPAGDALAIYTQPPVARSHCKGLRSRARSRSCEPMCSAISSWIPTRRPKTVRAARARRRRNDSVASSPICW